MSKKILSIFLTFLSFSFISASAEKVRLGYYEQEGFQKGRGPEDIRSGYGYEYVQLVATKAGWTYEYVFGEKEELLQKVKDGEIDLLAGVEDLPENRESMAFPNSPMGQVDYSIFKDNSNENFIMENVSDLNGRKIGMIFEPQMMYYLNNFINENDVDCEVIFFKGIVEQKNALLSREVDCIVESSSHIVMESGLSPVYSIGENRLYLAVNKNRSDLVDKLNKSINELVEEKPYFLEALIDSYNRRNHTNIGITPEENRWIQTHPVIRVGFVKEYLPFCDEEKGEVVGILPSAIEDMMTLLGISNRMKVEYVWDESYWNLFNRLKTGEIDIVFPVFKSLWHSEELDCMETDAVCPASCDLIYSGEYSEELPKLMAISEHSPIQKIYADLYFPKSEIVWCADADECLTAVATGKANCTIFSSYRASFKLSQKVFRKLKALQLSNDNGYGFAVSSGNTKLLGILNKGINLLNSEKITMQMYEFTSRKNAPTFVSFFINHILEVVLSVLGIVVLFFVILVRHAVLLKKASTQIQRELEMVDCLARDYQNVYRLNLKDETFTVIRMTGYSPEGIKPDRNNVYPYTKFMNKYVGLRVFGMDSDKFAEVVDITYVRNRLSTEKEYSYDYRVFDDGKIHYYKCRFINLGTPGVSNEVILAFSNIDEIIQTTKENEMLKYKAEVDGLTGITNRSCGEHAARQLIFNGINALFCIFDVDKFKTINDTFGHQAGDKVLLGIASCLKASFSDEDIVFRLGGDEFVVLVPNISTQEEAMPLLEKFMDSIRALELYELEDHKVSVSIGAVLINPEERNFDDYYAKADSCVYESKKKEGCAVSFSEDRNVGNK